MIIHKRFVTVLLTVSAISLSLSAQTSGTPLTAAEAIKRIIAATGATPPPDTVDTIKGGDPNTVVTGIATTFLDTYQVLEKAVADNKNFIITHEPTFYNHPDDMTVLGDDAVQAQKRAYIKEHHLVVWRFHDTWHLRHPDGILEGVIDEFGWKPNQSTSDPNLFTIPQTTVAQLAGSLRAKTGLHIMRVIGDPKMPVTQVALMPGAAGLTRQVKMLERDDVQVLVAGEAAEWETVEYARDASAQGRHKALILLGHEISEEAGMRYCAEWLKSVLPGVPIEYIRAGEPYWMPGQ
ncbi:Nif3-like dinuclear metal center hexameric protein [Alloacidobacterium dinghuense]|uniref:Nif3-like dinuclear metal center hexameric protein n=1 Tax=Alloacidobacterium dinghuense TaxID=2763107 RepID=A0A7G8BNF1_9BACT|nr:Nif3-like dinuclear metal center hexameric protein [Alloacidobacterium dinghuense]QNI34071.1 Nif3-like dinuclear metal center hexameric protein [Alloacidobacterium dinghuense]